MEKYVINLSTLFLLLSIFGCGSTTINKSNREKLYECKNQEFSTWLNGDEKYGDGHFPSKDGEIIYGQLQYSPSKALIELEKEVQKANKIIDDKMLFDESGKKVGRKVLFYKETKFEGFEEPRKTYNLYWTKNSIFTLISSEALSSVKEVEKECNF
jgi:hypothetical protein